MYPGSTSDCLAFEGMALYQRLEEGLLAPGLCLFGNNAYINSLFMATPFPGASGGSKDAYNFYHSQVRIRIECAFGPFVPRWAILRKALPVNISIKKSVVRICASLLSAASPPLMRQPGGASSLFRKQNLGGRWKLVHLG